MSAVLELDDVTVIRRGRTVLRDVSLSLHRGEVLAVGTAAEIAEGGTLAERLLAMTGEDAEAIEA